MKRALIIAGGLAVLGGIFYFYSKNQKDGEKANENKPAEPNATPTPTPTSAGTVPTGTSTASTTTQTSVVNSELAPLPVAYGQVEMNLEKAQDIVRKLLKGKKWSDVKASTLKSINAKVVKLGYTYKEGVLTKI